MAVDLEVAAERIGVVADVDTHHGIGRHLPTERIEHRRRSQPAAPVVADTRPFLGTPDRPPFGHVDTLIDRRDHVGQVGGERRRGHTDVAEHRHLDRVEATDCHRVVVDLDDRLVGGDAGVVRERCAQHDQQVGFVHEIAGDRSAAASEHPTAERVVVGDLPLGFERGQHRRAEPFSELRDSFHVVAGAMADDEHRPARVRE